MHLGNFKGAWQATVHGVARVGHTEPPSTHTHHFCSDSIVKSHTNGPTYLQGRLESVKFGYCYLARTDII